MQIEAASVYNRSGITLLYTRFKWTLEELYSKFFSVFSLKS